MITHTANYNDWQQMQNNSASTDYTTYYFTDGFSFTCWAQCGIYGVNTFTAPAMPADFHTAHPEAVKLAAPLQFTVV